MCAVLTRESCALQGLLKGRHGGNGSDRNSSDGDSGASAGAGDAAGPAERQDFPEKRKHMFCYKAPSDSLLIQARQHLKARLTCLLGSNAQYGGPG